LTAHSLTFEQPDVHKFPCLGLAHYALDHAGNTACIINAANEVAVAAFLRDAIGFNDIYRTITTSLERVEFIANPSLDDLVATNALARTRAAEFINTLSHSR
ncbi:MAG: 1-deoxy-D-xylulose-5-phosphate reductoisomerase, partial [Muribaculaceae bacterium]